jgi:hypothetical protein
MRIEMQMTVRNEMVQIQRMERAGGATGSIFSKLDAWLEEDDQRVRAIEFVAMKKDMARYASMIDFLFCETFTWYRRACFQFYAGQGPSLIDIATPAEIAHWEHRLLIICEHACAAETSARRLSWSSFRKEALRLSGG